MEPLSCEVILRALNFHRKEFKYEYIVDVFCGAATGSAGNSRINQQSCVVGCTHSLGVPANNKLFILVESVAFSIPVLCLLPCGVRNTFREAINHTVASLPIGCAIHICCYLKEGKKCSVSTSHAEITVCLILNIFCLLYIPLHCHFIDFHNFIKKQALDYFCYELKFSF